MEGVMGILRLRVKRGTNLAIRDRTRGTSDPYVVATLDHQKTKTKIVRDNCNPVWEDDLTLTIKDPKVPIKLTVYDKDTFSEDDNMGVTSVDVNPYFECLQMGSNLHHLPVGTKLETVQPNEHNRLVEESHIIWNNKAITQDMVLRLTDVESGEIEVQIEITPIENHRLSIFKT
ncbi:protein C2-DOMAIN ABA-RELATED 10-like [Cynara cardunculus var. scolymus]|uniref:C2 calcium-dependent membrane targeting n=1 Tax=Cynara cardunculus var. scolymus TaxID=59895 RepID=A0A103XVJ8_CYNCS|nr:protein C2-DOMAIN ABA-RELATED 10-like [Cynara cardunculus var. scolymus]KVH97665.1 C2 calcium-dependent membrane targeting [Cynara cardunculus var. scolymus]